MHSHVECKEEGKNLWGKDKGERHGDVGIGYAGKMEWLEVEVWTWGARGYE